MSQSTEGDIELQVIDKVARLTIARPAKRNSFDDRLIDIFVKTIRRLIRQDIHVVVLTGAGSDSFCAGYDITCIDPDQSLDEPFPDVRFERIIDAVRQISVPVIAVLNGDAYGGGLDLALACDFRVARRGIRAAMTPCRLGLVYSASGMARFVTRLGGQVTRRLFLTARPFNDEQLVTHGIVDELVEEVELTVCVSQLVKSVTANAPLAVSGTKYTIDQVEKGLAATPDVIKTMEFHRRTAFSSPELRRRLDAFKKK